MFNSQKFKETVLVVIFVSLGSLIRVSILMDGFIVAFSVIMLAIFFYTYEHLSPIYIAFFASIFAPICRVITMSIGGMPVSEAAILTLPDVFYLFAYGVIYRSCYIVINKRKTRNNFLLIIVFADIMSNVIEVSIRSIIANEMLLTFKILQYLVAIAVIRTMFIGFIVIAIDSYSRLVAAEEHDEEYKKLSVMASDIESELYIMQKNIGEIEALMKDAYTLSKELEDRDAGKELREKALDIAKNAHEIKGDYVRAIITMKEVFVEKYEKHLISIKDITQIIRTDIQNSINSKGLNVSFYVNLKANFYVKYHFEMVTIIRNLIYNSLEAITDSNLKRKTNILLEVLAEGDNFIINVRDNGPGIPKQIIDDIFINKFSTKFSDETGNMYRGIGLVVVKDYIKDSFNGEIKVESEENKYTVFTITIPKSSVSEEVKHEILYN